MALRGGRHGGVVSAALALATIALLCATAIRAETIYAEVYEALTGNTITRNDQPNELYRASITIGGMAPPQQGSECAMKARLMLQDRLKRGMLRLNFTALPSVFGHVVAEDDETARAMIREGMAYASDPARFAEEAQHALENGIGCVHSHESTLPKGIFNVPMGNVGESPTVRSAHGRSELSSAANRQEQLTSFPPGFKYEVVANVPAVSADFRFLPSGNILGLQTSGKIYVVENGEVLGQLFSDLSAITNDYFDRGCTSFVLSPNFQVDNMLWVYCTYENDPSPSAYGAPKTNRVIRMQASGNVEVPNSRVTVLGRDVGAGCASFGADADCIPANARGHTGGGMAFDPAGYLYVACGDAAPADINGNAQEAQDLDVYNGKVLKVDRMTGAGLSSNPFYQAGASLSSRRSKIYALGIRSVIKMEPGRVAGDMLLGDVQWETEEEVDVLTRGSNLGWPCFEADIESAAYKRYDECASFTRADMTAPPIITWPHNGRTAAATIGEYVTRPGWPNGYTNVQTYLDLAGGWIGFFEISSSDKFVRDIARVETTGTPVALRNGPDNALYVLDLRQTRINKLTYAGASPSGSLSVTGRLPAPGSTVNPAGVVVIVSLSRSAQQSTIGGGNVRLVDASGKTVPSTVTANEGQAIIQLTPSSDTLADGAYSVEVTGGSSGVIDLDGNSLPADVTWSFNVAGNSSDDGPLRIVSRTPDGSAPVPVNSKVTIVFNKDLNETTVTADRFIMYQVIDDKRASRVDLIIEYVPAQRSVVLTPRYPLLPGARYRVRVNSSVADSSGGLLRKNRWFRVDTTPLGLNAIIDTPKPFGSIPPNSKLSFSGRVLRANGSQVPPANYVWTLIIQHCFNGINCHQHIVQSLDGVASGSITAPLHEGSYYYIVQLTAKDGSDTGLAQTRVDHT